MATPAGGKLENVVASLQKYLAANWTLTNIQWPGVEFRESEHREWIRPDLLIGEGQFYRQVGNGYLGKELLMLFNINILGKIDMIEGGDTLRLLTLRDALRGLFSETVHIPIYDLVGGDDVTVIGEASCFASRDIDLGQSNETGTFQRNLSVEIRYEEKMAGG